MDKMLFLKPFFGFKIFTFESLAHFEALAQC